MMYKLEFNLEGEYAKADSPEERYNINECETAYTPQGINVGYTFYDSRSAFLNAHNLIPYEQYEQATRYISSERLS